MLGGMRGERRVEIREFRRAPGGGMDASSNDDPARRESFAVIKCNLEALGTGFDADNFAWIEIRQCLTLVPQAILDESFERHGLRKMITSCRLKRFKRE